MKNTRTKKPEAAFVLRSGAASLPLLEVDTYNEELRDGEGFIGDRASNRAFRAILEEWRERLREIDEEDPLGERRPSTDISKKKLDRVLQEGDPLAAGVIHSVIEDFAGELATVTQRFLRLKAWRDTQRIVIGGGLRESRVGEVTIGRAAVLVKAAGHAVDLVPIRNHPDEAGLIGTAHLAPSWLFSGAGSRAAMLAVDIGGSNIRAGLLELRLQEGGDLSKCRVHTSELWRHCDEEPTREEAVDRLVAMLQSLAKIASKNDLTLMPLIGIGCPGVIDADGSIQRGGQNLPGNWESSRFNLPERIRAQIPKLNGHETQIVMHNDAVVQGLSEAPFMRDVSRWGVLTMGTGLGNARFSNHEDVEEEEPLSEVDDEEKSADSSLESPPSSVTA